MTNPVLCQPWDVFSYTFGIAVIGFSLHRTDETHGLYVRERLLRRPFDCIERPYAAPYWINNGKRLAQGEDSNYFTVDSVAQLPDKPLVPFTPRHCNIAQRLAS